jgi:hypothetical protein
MDIISLPTFNDASWFKNLANISKKLFKQEEKHENAKTFFQNVKVIMAKLKVCKYYIYLMKEVFALFIFLKLTLLIFFFIL